MVSNLSLQPKMDLLPAVLIVAVLSGANTTEFFSCSWILDASVDCSRFRDSESCGTDGTTYKNKCYFSQAHCNNADLHLLHPGACNSIDFQTTPIPAQGAEIVLDFFCTSLSHTSCGVSLNVVCGTDGRTYQNSCEYEKARCTHRDLHVASFGNCSS